MPNKEYSDHYPPKKIHGYKLLKILYYCDKQRSLFPEGYILKNAWKDISKLSDIDFYFAFQWLQEPEDYGNPEKIPYIYGTKIPGYENIDSLDAYSEFRLSPKGKRKCESIYAETKKIIIKGAKTKRNKKILKKISNNIPDSINEDIENDVNDYIKNNPFYRVVSKMQSNVEHYLNDTGKSFQEEINKISEKMMLESEIAMIKILYNLLSYIDIYTVCHQCNVATLVKHMCFNIFPDDKSKVYDYTIAALLHDIGKFIISDSILSRPQKPTRAQFELIKEHPLMSREIILKCKLPFVRNFDEIAKLIHQHHYTLDGKGYPEYDFAKNKKGEIIEVPIKPPNEIVEGAKILAVADVFEAIVSPRPYKPAFSREKAFNDLEVINKGKYDPGYIQVCKIIVNNEKFLFPMYKREHEEAASEKKISKSSQANHFKNHLYEYNPDAIDIILNMNSRMV